MSKTNSFISSLPFLNSTVYAAMISNRNAVFMLCFLVEQATSLYIKEVIQAAYKGGKTNELYYLRGKKVWSQVRSGWEKCIQSNCKGGQAWEDGQTLVY